MLWAFFCIPSRDYHYNIFLCKINLIGKNTYKKEKKVGWLDFSDLYLIIILFYLVWGNIFITEKIEIPRCDQSRNFLSWIFYFKRVKMKRVWKCGNAPIKSYSYKGETQYSSLYQQHFHHDHHSCKFLWNKICWIDSTAFFLLII